MIWAKKMNTRAKISEWVRPKKRIGKKITRGAVSKETFLPILFSNISASEEPTAMIELETAQNNPRKARG